MFLERPTINVDDIKRLIEHEVCESRSLEYKSELPKSGDEKRKFLYEISAMANGGGGDIIYGVQEDEGRPVEANGVKSEDVDQTVLRLENLIRDCISPRIVGIVIESLKVDEERYIFVFKIPRTLNSPHMVTIGGRQRFYTRNSTGKHPMDITEIKTAILTGANAIQNCEDWYHNRLIELRLNSGPVLLQNKAKLVLHLIPFSSVISPEYLDARTLEQQQRKVLPLPGLSTSSRYNSAGFLTLATPSNKEPYGYVQFFRTGQIESVDIGMFKPYLAREIPISELEEKVINSSGQYLEALKNVGINLPIMMKLTLLGVNGYYIAPQKPFDQPRPISEDDLILPGVLIEGWNVDTAQLLKPMFDTIWNACGKPCSPNYDEEGNRFPGGQ